ncbi:immunoglobulin I-set domain protein, partial [Necator americanus]
MCLADEPVEETCVPAGAIATINCETITEEHNIEWLKERVPIHVRRDEPKDLDIRFVADDSEDGHNHSLTIVSIEPSDAGEYGVIIDGRYTTVTKIVVTESEVFTQSIFEEPEVDVSLQMYSVRDDASVDLIEKRITVLEKDVHDETRATQEITHLFASKEQPVENGFDFVDIIDEADDEYRKEEFYVEKIDETAFGAAAAVAVEMTEKLFQDTFVELEEIQRRGEVISYAQEKGSAASTPESEQFEEIADVCVEFPTSDEDIPSPKEQRHDEETIKFGDEEHHFVATLVRDSINDAMKEAITIEITTSSIHDEVTFQQKQEDGDREIPFADSSATTVEEQSLDTQKEDVQTITAVETITSLKHEQEKIKSEEENRVVRDLDDVPHADDAAVSIPLFKKETIASEMSYGQESAALLSADVGKIQSEEVLIPLELYKDPPSYCVERSVPRARKCKLTVFLTFDEKYDLLPVQEVQLSIDFNAPPEAEVTEVILSQIMYEDDEASTIEDTLTSLSSSCLYTVPEFLVPLKNSYEIREKSRALFKVVVKGVPLPRIAWFHNDNLLNPEKNILNIVCEDGVSFLEICECTEKWSGVLTCEAMNSAGTCKIKSEISVTPEGIDPYVVQHYRLQCLYLQVRDFSEREELPVEIHLDGIPCQTDVEFVVPCLKQSEFRAASFSVEEDLQPTRSISPFEDENLSELSISSATGQSPAFTVALPPQVYSKLNESIQLKCSFTGQPLPSVTWEKDGNLVDLNKNYTIITEDGITILRLEYTTLEDNAIFSCTIANSFGMLTSQCRVIVEDDVHVHKNVAIRVICDRESASAEVNAVLNGPSQMETKFSTRPAVDKQKELEEETITENEIQEISYGQAPYFQLPLQDGYFAGNKCVLKCIVVATPPAQVQWIVNEEMITDDENHRVIIEDGIAILQILNISCEELKISCTAINNYGKSVTTCHRTRSTFKLENEIPQSPFFILPLKDIECCEEEVQLKCVLSGEPLPKITWIVNGKELKEECGASIYEDGITLLSLKNLKKGETKIAECKHLTTTKLVSAEIEKIIVEKGEREQQKEEVALAPPGTTAEKTVELVTAAPEDKTEKVQFSVSEKVPEKVEEITVEKTEQKDEAVVVAQITAAEKTEQEVDAVAEEKKPAEIEK